MMTLPTARADPTTGPLPFRAPILQIEPKWIDSKGHLNLAYYNVLFDRGIDQFWLELGIGSDYMKTRNGSTFTAECHVRYLREIHLGDPVQVRLADRRRRKTSAYF
jgi:acyl-CoA thioester hydrolase